MKVIVAIGFEWQAGAGLGGEIQPIAEHLQQALLEHAQCRLERRAAAQLLEGDRKSVV